MPRCPLTEARWASSELRGAPPRPRAPPPRATSPFADGGTRPHRIITPSDSRSCIRTTATLWDTATLKRTENCHQGWATESSLSASARSGITNRSLIEGERTTDRPIAEVSAPRDTTVGARIQLARDAAAMRRPTKDQRAAASGMPGVAFSARGNAGADTPTDTARLPRVTPRELARRTTLSVRAHRLLDVNGSSNHLSPA